MYTVDQEGVNEFYDGSQVFINLTHATGLPIDQINFLVCQLVALVLGIALRKSAGPERVSASWRHVFEICVGIPLTYFCFGRQILLLVAQTSVSLLMMRVLSPGVMEKCVLIYSMGFLCICHLHRMYYDYGGYTLDITGPLMLNTQRLSSLAYNLRDGLTKDQHKLTDSMKKLAIRKPPSLLEAVSYVFCFHGIMVGPFCFYKDYIAFIEGVSLHKDPHQQTNGHANNNDNAERSIENNHKYAPPAMPESVLIKKLITTAVFGITTVTILPLFPSRLLTDAEFSLYSFLYKNLLVVFTMSLTRHKYYFAWKLGESVNAAAGLCFNGYDSQGKPRWDLADNADIFRIEFARSTKEILDYWNMSTTHWLRYVIYERTHSTMLVFLFSALWHGFYAGYYLTFLSAGLLLIVSKMLRRRLRPMFQSTRQLALFYDFITFLITKFALPYLGFPFVLLALGPCMQVYSNLLFHGHVATLLMFFFLSYLDTRQKSKSH